MIPDEFNDERNDWEEHCEYPPEDIVPGERMGVCVGGPEDGHRFPIARVMCECCDGPATHYACKHEDAAAYSVYILDESSILCFTDVKYRFDHYETEEGDEWIPIEPMESED